MDNSSRIRAYLEKCPGAVSGQGGDAATFGLACRIHNGFALAQEETFQWLQHWNSKCEPPWSDKELRHKAGQAAKAEHPKPRGHLLDGGTGPRHKGAPALVIRKVTEQRPPVVLWSGRLEPTKNAVLGLQNPISATDATDVFRSSCGGNGVSGGGVEPLPSYKDSETSVASVAEGADWLVQEVMKRFGATIIEEPIPSA